MTSPPIDISEYELVGPDDVAIGSPIIFYVSGWRDGSGSIGLFHGIRGDRMHIRPACYPKNQSAEIRFKISCIERVECSPKTLMII
jgi:hypothetical protein